MMVSASPRAITLGIYPTARGFGWTAFADPFLVIDFGVFTEINNKDQACLGRIAKLLAQHEPETVVLEAFDADTSMRHPRIRMLSQRIRALAEDRGHTVEVYSRGEVREAFSEVRASTRDEIAAAVARSVPSLAHRLPPPRKPHESEDKRLSIFNAAAIVLTHYRYGATAFLDDLRDAA